MKTGSFFFVEGIGLLPVKSIIDIISRINTAPAACMISPSGTMNTR